jgi:uncharacterized protein (TIGR02246 family)
MPTTATLTREDAPIRERLDAWAEALRAKDIDALLVHYAPDVLVFDLMPLQTQGIDAYRENFEAWFESVEGPIEYEMTELRIRVREDVALCHYLGRVGSTRGGKKGEYRVRVTASLHKKGGRWLITHEHISLPFKDPQAMRAALGG